MIDNADFHELCDSFEKEIEEAGPETFRPETETVISLGNQRWQVQMFCRDENVEDPSWPLITLFRTRRDLVYPLIEADRFRDFLKAAHNLAEWLDGYGFAVSLESKTRIGTIKLAVFNVFVNVFNFFNPHN